MTAIQTEVGAGIGTFGVRPQEPEVDAVYDVVGEVVSSFTEPIEHPEIVIEETEMMDVENGALAPVIPLRREAVVVEEGPSVEEHLAAKFAALGEVGVSPELVELLSAVTTDICKTFLADAEWRVKQAYAVASRGEGLRHLVDSSIYAEDINDVQHRITGYTLTANNNGTGTANGYISWTDVHIVFMGIDYTAANGNTNNRYVWFVKPASGTTVTLNTGNSKPSLTANDCLVFINDVVGGVSTAINALTHTIPSVVGDRAVDTGSIQDNAVTSAKASFYTAFSNAITNAQSAADLAQATADGAIVTYYQSNRPWADGSTQPASVTGDIWYDSDSGEQAAYRWSGASGSPANTWVLIRDNQVTAAIGAANNAQTTANGKITTFYAASSATPTATAIGDLWVVTDQGNQLRRASATGTGSWVTMQMGENAIANTAITNAKIASGVDGAKLSSGTVGATQIGAAAITPIKLNTVHHVLY